MRQSLANHEERRPLTSAKREKYSMILIIQFILTKNIEILCLFIFKNIENLCVFITNIEILCFY